MSRTRQLLCAGAVLGFAVCGMGATEAVAQARGPVGGDRFLDVIVVLDPAFAPGGHVPNRAEARRVARGFGVRPRVEYGTAVFGFAARIPEGRLSALERDPRVLYVDMDAPVALPMPRPAAPPWCTPDSGHPACADDDGGGGGGGQEVPWGVERIGANGAGATGQGIHVYVLDTGIDSDHPDLAARLGNGMAVERCKGGSCRFDWDDDYGHGTHVAGTIGATNNDLGVVGVAHDVILHAVKVLSKQGSGVRSGVIEGIDWMAAQVSARGAPAVANMSLGGAGSMTGSCVDGTFSGNDSYHQAICNASAVGVVFAVAAGNEGADAELTLPAAYDDTVVTATATDQTDDWPFWSNWGDDEAFWDDPDSGEDLTPDSAPVSIAAPGVGVLSTAIGGGTTIMSGTSMASPHVAGTIARFLEAYPQTADFSAFTNARAALVAWAESTSGFPNTSGHIHNEDFLAVGGF